MLALALALAATAHAADPTVTMYQNFNQALNIPLDNGTSQGGTITTLGSFADVAACQKACIESKGPRCWSFVHMKDKTCLGVISPGFNPSYDENAVSGVVDWPCRNDDDCSLNGKCAAGKCNCRPAWKGARCETLNLLKATKGAGYRGVDDGHNTSSWGGAVLQGPDGKWHMWAAEMTEHCGIGAWAQNSRIIRATSDTPGGNYKRTQVVWEVFSHEPEVVPGNNGEYVMYFTAQLRSPHGDCNCCRTGQGPCDGSTGPGDCGHSPFMNETSTPTLGDSDPSWMSWTKVQFCYAQHPHMNIHQSTACNECTADEELIRPLLRQYQLVAASISNRVIAGWAHVLLLSTRTATRTCALCPAYLR
jgi:hypothetical protein